jgi:hypothetical protein
MPTVAAPLIKSFSPDSNIVGDGITDSGWIAVAGTATPSSTVQLFDGSVFLGSAVVDGTGAWLFRTATLSNGVHAFTATDVVGGVSSQSSATLNVTVDTVAPASPAITSWSPNSVNNVDYGVTNSNQLTLNGTAEANSSVTVFDNGIKIGTTVASSAGVWTFNTAAVPDGINAFTASATDAAGNTSSQTYFATHVVVDTATTASQATASSLVGGAKIGVMMEGAESSWIGFPAAKDLDYLKSNGVDLIRLPISWELMQNSLNGSLNQKYLAGLEAFFDQAAARGVQVVIELHNHGEYDINWQQDMAAHGGIFSSAWQLGQPIGSSAVPVSSFANFWTQLSTALKGHAAVAGYDLMNEPANISASTWQSAAQSAVNAIRAVDTNTPLYVEGASWSVASTWQLPWYSGTLHISDPSNNIYYEAHQYFDPNSSGLYQQAFDPNADYTNIGVDLLKPWVNWLNANGYQGFLGEFGAPVNDARWLPIVNAVLDYLQVNGISATYCNYTYNQWAGISISPDNSQGTAMMDLIFEHTAPSIAGYVPVNGTGNGANTTANILKLTGTGASYCSVNVYDKGILVGTTTSDVSGAWSFTTVAMSSGAHNFTATNVNATGHSSETSFSMTVTIDPVAPLAPTIVSFSPDTGVAGDGVTNVNHVTLTGSAAAGTTVEVFDGSAQIGTAIANAGGAWNLATGTLADGSHAFTSKAVDAAGNASAASGVLNVTIDTVAPPAPTVTTFSPHTGAGGDGITNANHITLTGAAAAGTTVEIFDGSTQIGAATTSASGIWSFATGTLADGAHGFTAEAVDAAGNASPASSIMKLTVDTVAPSAPTLSLSSASGGVAPMGGDVLTSTSHVTLSGTAAAGSTVDVFDGATLIGATTSDGNGNWSFATAALADGSHPFTSKTVDSAGNISAASTALNITVGSWLFPTGTSAAPTETSVPPHSGAPNDGVTNANSLALTDAAADTSVGFGNAFSYPGNLLRTILLAGHSQADEVNSLLVDRMHSNFLFSADAGGVKPGNPPGETAFAFGLHENFADAAYLEFATPAADFEHNPIIASKHFPGQVLTDTMANPLSEFIQHHWAGPHFGDVLMN